MDFSPWAEVDTASAQGPFSLCRAMVKEIPADEFAQRLHALRGPIKTVLHRFRVPAADAEDVMQEVFLVVWRKWASIDNLESFVVGVTRHKCWNWLKRHYLRHRGLASIEEIHEELAIPPPQGAIDRAQRLEVTLASLRPRERKVLRLRWLGYTHGQIAELLGLAESSARKLFDRTLRRLNKEQRLPTSPRCAARRKR